MYPTKEPIYKHYGLTGKTIRVRIRDGHYSHAPLGEIKDMTIPVKITAEYKKFLCGIVMPHYNPAGMGMSNPWPITLDKYAISVKDIKIIS